MTPHTVTTAGLVVANLAVWLLLLHLALTMPPCETDRAEAAGHKRVLDESPFDWGVEG